MNAGAGSIHQQECGLHGTDVPEAPRVPLLKPSPREKTGAVRASGMHPYTPREDKVPPHESAYFARGKAVIGWVSANLQRPCVSLKSTPQIRHILFRDGCKNRFSVN